MYKLPFPAHSSPRSRASRGALAAAVLVAVLAPAIASATLTAPALAISAIDVEYTEDDGVLLRVRGIFPFADMIDEPYPLMLFVHTTEKNKDGAFLCFSGPWGPMRGAHPIVRKMKEGLTPEILDAIGPTLVENPDAAIVSFAPDQIEVLLPPGFPKGKVEAQLFVIYREAPLFSNPLSGEIEEEKW